MADQYDFCIIDNAPDINVSTINALTACDDVLIPVEIDDNTTEGLPELVNQIGYTKEELNPELKNYWVFITKYDKNNLAQAQGTEMIEAAGYPIA
ncbi:MAG: ParA family protein [Ruminococcus sp.]